MPLVVRSSRENDFEMDERDYLLQAEPDFVESTTTSWKRKISNVLCGQV